MGAITFNLDHKLIGELQRHLPLRLFVETGTFRGETLQTAENYFDRCISIELSPEYHAEAVRQFADQRDRITLIQGDSPVRLRDQRPAFADCSTFFWLDAHWCAAENTAGETSQCPLLEELAAIGTLRSDSVVLIDDARLFLTPPPLPHEISLWPDLSALLDQFRKLSDGHALIHYNDVLLFLPNEIYPKLKPFFQEHTFNLLTYADKARAYDALLEQAKSKDKEISQLAKEAQLRLDEVHRLSADVIRLRAAAEGSNPGQTGNGPTLADEVIALRHQLHHVQARLHQAEIDASKTNLRKRNTKWARFVARWQRRLAARSKHPLAKLRHHDPRPLRPERFPRRTEPAAWPRICIITPSYQQGHFLERTMLSVLDQNYPNLAYGVQDGGSTDESAVIINRHVPRLSHAESAPDEGQSDAIHRGFKRLYPGHDDIMAWLNSDDILLPGVLRYVGAYFARHPEVDVVYGHRVIIDENDQEVGRWFMPPYHAGTLKWFDLVPQETLFWRSRCYEEVGGVDKTFQFALDWDLLLKFEYAGFNIQRLPYFLGGFRTHRGQKTSAKIQSVGEQEMAKLRQRIHGREVPAWEVHRHLSEEIHRSAVVEWLHRFGLRG